MQGLKVCSSAILALILTLSGCVNTPPAAESKPASEPPPAKPSEASSPDMNTMVLHYDAVTVTKKVPKLVGVNEPYSYDLNMSASDAVGQVTLTEELPSGVHFVKSDPEASLNGNQMIWVVPSMQKGESRVFHVTLMPDQVGNLTGETQVNIQRVASVTTTVGKPGLSLEESGPSIAPLGADMGYDIKITNIGTAVARNIEVTASVPEGLNLASGSRKQVYTVGNLDPGQSKTLKLPLRAVTRGQFRSEASATAANAASASADIVTRVVLQAVDLSTQGPDEQYVGKTAAYDVVLRNTGDVSLKNVVITNDAPADTSIVSAEGAKLSGTSAVWQLAELPQGSERHFGITLASSVPGLHKNLVNVKSAEGVAEESAFSTTWKGLPGLLMTTVDTVDPVRQGETTDFVITLTNQGTAPDTNIKVAMSFPAGLAPISVGGASPGSISGQIVSFAPYASLSPKQTITWTVKARGIAVGDNRTRVQFTSDSIKVPVMKDESTQVY